MHPSVLCQLPGEVIKCIRKGYPEDQAVAKGKGGTHSFHVPPFLMEMYRGEDKHCVVYLVYVVGLFWFRYVFRWLSVWRLTAH